MDEYFLGTVKEIHDHKIIFECNNHGYNIEGVNLATLPLNLKVKLYVYSYQKPNYQQYFGFLNAQIKLFFIDLLNVSSVGPKTALKLLNNLTIATIKLAITKQDSKILQQCKGITPKIANNIISYFNNHLKVINQQDHDQFHKSNLVFDTLIKLGFTKETINRFLLTDVNWKLAIEEIIALAIKTLNHEFY